jgi:hypothetical protein
MLLTPLFFDKNMNTDTNIEIETKRNLLLAKIQQLERQIDQNKENTKHLQERRMSVPPHNYQMAICQLGNAFESLKKELKEARKELESLNEYKPIELQPAVKAVVTSKPIAQISTNGAVASVRTASPTKASSLGKKNGKKKKCNNCQKCQCTKFESLERKTSLQLRVLKAEVQAEQRNALKADNIELCEALAEKILAINKELVLRNKVK